MLVESQRKIIDARSTQTGELGLALNSEKKALAGAKVVIADYQKELDRVRGQRDFARSLAVIGTGVALVVGIVVGALLGGK